MTVYGAGYQPTPVRDIDLVFRHIMEHEPSFNERVFVDVGSGKGKVLARWGALLAKHGMSQRMVGVELDPVLAGKTPHGEWSVTVGDALTFGYGKLGGPLLLWVFNPFSGNDFHRLLDAVSGVDTMMVVNNPDDALALVESGWGIPIALFREGQRNSWYVAVNGGQ